MIKLAVALIILTTSTLHSQEPIPPPRERNYDDDIIPSPASRSGVIVDDSGSIVWPKWSCPIAYTIDGTVTSTESQYIVDAMAYITSVTGWTFVAQTDETDYLNFFDGGGCWSYVGKLTTQPQQISITDGCGFGAAVHEIGHALGISHEQSRPDRDTYVTIHTDNIDDAKEYNFAIENTLNPGDYDFDSIMHYGQWAFSDNTLQTITTNVALTDVCYIGQRRWLSEDDIIHYNQLIDGAHCNTPTVTCDDTHIWLCAPGTSLNLGDTFWGEYEVGGTCNGKDYYVSINPPTLYIWWYVGLGGRWHLAPGVCTGGWSAFATDADLIGSTTWQRYDGSSFNADSTMVATQVSCTSVAPTKFPTKFPTKYPTNAPTTSEPSIAPTKFPIKFPTSTPSQTPSKFPTKFPTSTPLQTPSKFPTAAPIVGTNDPSTTPSKFPTSAPSKFPTSTPSQTPSKFPTKVPTKVPTAAPIIGTSDPSTTPSKFPSKFPTSTPSQTPSQTPSKFPTKVPTKVPTKSKAPSKFPTKYPTQFPSQTPSKSPSKNPTEVPSETPSQTPSQTHSKTPTQSPISSQTPTNIPSQTPTNIPSQTPTNIPSQTPTNVPSQTPSQTPTKTPSETPSKSPSEIPTETPSKGPSEIPTETPSKNPSQSPTLTDEPTTIPTSVPTAIVEEESAENMFAAIFEDDEMMEFGNEQKRYSMELGIDNWAFVFMLIAGFCALNIGIMFCFYKK